MIEILLFFIGAALLLYVLLGGSDYGAGILEMLPVGKLRDEQKHLINEAMGPVWEANHVWLIVLVVILFMGFPGVFVPLMTYLHVPMLALLVGIVIRGATFTFRHYDAVQEEKSQRVYTWLFGGSSIWTAFWLGVIAASLGRGLIDVETQDVWSAYFAPWIGWYPAAMGVFVICIFAFLASVYLIGETEEPELRRLFIRRAAVLNVLVVLAGGLVFAVSYGEKENLPSVFFAHPLTLGVLAVATGLFVALWVFVRKHCTALTRIVAAGQVTLILLGWWLLYAPNALITAQGEISFYEAAAPEATLWQLVLALLVGSCFIFPSLFFLLKVFKTKGREEF